MRCLSQFVLLAALALAVAAQPVSAQNEQRYEQWAQRPVAQKVNRDPNGNGMVKGQPGARAMAGLPPKWIQRLQDLPPDEQQRFLQNNQQFQNLPPERQEQIRRNLDRWNHLSPEQKEQLRRGAEALDRMTPEQRQYVRNTLLPKWQAMPRDRRQVINQHLRMLSNMSPSTQQAALNDPKFMEGLSPDEQSMLRDLNSLRNAPPQTPQQ